MTPHEAAQSLWWFVALVVVGIGVVMWWDMNKDKTATRGVVRKDKK